MNCGNGSERISKLDEPGVGFEEMVRDVRSRLSSDPKDLSAWPKYFYDARGSRIFEEITETPEYYQTGTKLSILRERAREIISRTECRALIEVGYTPPICFTEEENAAPGRGSSSRSSWRVSP